MRRRWTPAASTTSPTSRPSPASTAGNRERAARRELRAFQARALQNNAFQRIDSMIVAEHLRKTFPGKGKDKTPVVAVDDVGFTARDGEITGLLGPNGAGKTTTLRMLYTLMQPETGRVLVDGVDPALDASTVRRSLGVLPDARGVYKRLTARENI